MDVLSFRGWGRQVADLIKGPSRILAWFSGHEE